MRQIVVFFYCILFYWIIKSIVKREKKMANSDLPFSAILNSLQTGIYQKKRKSLDKKSALETFKGIVQAKAFLNSLQQNF